MKKSLFTAIMLFCFNAFSQECEILNPSVENVSEYLFKIAQSLTTIKIQFKNLASVKAKKNRNPSDVMVALKLIKRDFLCVASMIGSYKKSKNKNIFGSSDALSRSYQDLAAVADVEITEFKAMLDGKQNSSPGDVADRESERALDASKKWEKVMDAIDLATSAVVEKVDPKTNKTQRFWIKGSERDLIIKELKSQFRLPMKGDHNAMDETANFYYKCLTRKWRGATR